MSHDCDMEGYPDVHTVMIIKDTKFMKRYVISALTLLLSIGVTELSAQNFLRQLGESVKKEVKKEVESRVKKEVENRVKKTVKQSDDSPQTQNESENFYSEMKKKAPVANIATMVEYGPVTGTLNSHEWVDLGLPSGTRWATCNVDAASPEKPGKHYSWGETAAKTSYDAGNTSTYDMTIADIAGDKTYDVAASEWGEGWRMPTENEMRELLRYCGNQYVQKGGRWGREFTSSINQNSIFLPATGSKEGTRTEEANGCGLYWTSTPYDDNAAHMYTFGAALGEMSIGERYYGFAIRPVSDYDVDTDIPFDGETNGHKWVDLGLPSGLKWATCNVGSDAVDQDGNYYRWGDVSGYYSGGSYANEDVQKDISGDVNYDAATAQWGESWRMPSAFDFIELMENCTWEWTDIGRRKGLKVTSRLNGKYIFLPASGECNYTTDGDRLAVEINESLAYWTSTPKPGWQYTGYAYCFNILKEEVALSSAYRHMQGWCIRPVTK